MKTGGEEVFVNDVNNAPDFHVERGMIWVWIFCLCIENNFLCLWKESELANMCYKLKIGL